MIQIIKKQDKTMKRIKIPRLIGWKCTGNGNNGAVFINIQAYKMKIKI